MAEQIVNEFTVNRPIGEAWPIICDLERIAPCMPGAQLDEIEGDTYRGRVKVKLGTVATEFKGEARFVERDDDNHTAKLIGKGRDTKGRGNAAADIEATAEELSPTSTKITVVADLNISGRIAQIGRNIMGDVSKKLINEFSASLNTMIDNTMIDNAKSAPSAESDTSGDTEAAATERSTERSTGPQLSEGQPSVRKINGPAAEPIDIADYAGGAFLKRFAPVALAAILVVLLLKKLK